MAEEIDMGATPAELASHPGLLLDVIASMLPKRLALAYAVMALMGGTTREKVRSLLEQIGRQRWNVQKMRRGSDPAECFRQFRELSRQIATLEDVIYGLAAARFTSGTRLIPDIDPIEKGGM